MGRSRVVLRVPVNPPPLALAWIHVQLLSLMHEPKAAVCGRGLSKGGGAKRLHIIL